MTTGARTGIGLIGFEPKWWIIMAVFQHLLAILGSLEAKMVADQGKMKTCWEAAKSCLEKMKACQEATWVCLEKVKAKKDSDWEDIKAHQEVMEACQEKLEDKMEAHIQRQRPVKKRQRL
jgi:hypothetical protein